MISEDTYEDALDIINEMINQLGELEPSIEGYIDLLKFASSEVNHALSAAQSDL